MNQNIKKFIYSFVVICMIIVVAKLFIALLPWLILAIAVVYCVKKIKDVIKAKDNIDKNNVKTNFDNYTSKDIYENANDQYTTGEVIDVDYENVDK